MTIIKILAGVIIGATIMTIASMGSESEAQETVMAALELANKYAKALKEAKDYLAGIKNDIPEEVKKELERILEAK